MTLKDNRWGDKNQSGYYKEQDVEKAVLELKSKIYLRQEKRDAVYSIEIQILKDIDEIFGDFKE